MSQLEPIAVRADAPVVLDLPPTHLELSWRPLHARDVDGLFALIGAIGLVLNLALNALESKIVHWKGR